MALKPEEDAYGQEIWAHYQGRDSYEIVERDNGYFDASIAGPRTYFLKYEDWSQHEKKAMELVKGRVLDVGCGAGRHSLYLQSIGFDVLGIDISPLAIKVCQLRGLKKAQVMSIQNIDFRPNSFDTIIMMGNNFGLFGSPKKARRLLERFERITFKNALIIAQTRDPYKTDNPAHLEYHKFNKRKGRMGGQARIRIRFGKYATGWFDHLMVSQKEMKEILEGTGWRIKQLLDQHGGSYIAVIEKVA